MEYKFTILIIFTLFQSILCQFGDHGELPDLCKPDATNTIILNTVLKCTQTDCVNLAECVADGIVSLAQCSEEEKADEVLCNSATASFVLVESYRRLLAASTTAKCENAVKLRQTIKVCGSQSDGMDILVRHVSTLIGSSAAVSEEMESLASRRLFHGTMAIIMAFSLPGVLAVFSLPHVRLVIGMQLCALFLIYYYVHSRNGFFYAITVVACCCGVMIAEMMLIALVTRYSTPPSERPENRLHTD